MYFVVGELFMKIKEKDVFELKNFFLIKVCFIFELYVEISVNKLCLDRMKICNIERCVVKGIL